jgi:hypothetical protein
MTACIAAVAKPGFQYSTEFRGYLPNPPLQ